MSQVVEEPKVTEEAITDLLVKLGRERGPQFKASISEVARLLGADSAAEKQTVYRIIQDLAERGVFSAHSPGRPRPMEYDVRLLLRKANKKKEEATDTQEMTTSAEEQATTTEKEPKDVVTRAQGVIETLFELRQREAALQQENEDLRREKERIEQERVRLAEAFVEVEEVLSRAS